MAEKSRTVLVEEGASIPLQLAVAEILGVAAEIAGDDWHRSHESHGGIYMDRWRFKRLKASYDAARRSGVKQEGA